MKMQTNNHRQKKIEYLKGLITGKVVIHKPSEPMKNVIEFWDLHPTDPSLVVEERSKYTMKTDDFEAKVGMPERKQNIWYTLIVNPWIKRRVIKSEREHKRAEL